MNRFNKPEGAVEIRCSTPIDAIRTCNKFLGYTHLCFDYKYCKSCGKMNYYEVVTAKGLEIIKHL